ncbi:DVU0524 family FlgM-associated protein [Desulfobotulus sp.]|jgi:hypothetical protein|uniref:DVU0524 family FlgM-associated protein n=1 Tax=Desulfobotulus sp. TaxID=1940337 RepID=UPI002A364AEF|nr:DVU0524 family FlgM-associated protein [Desulfobotulus sp.]MDY0163017.1 DVU0524 family FlgM-associated protein [Desulfobotulus sp.]
MHVPSYQIHNVLKLYSRQITRNRLMDGYGSAKAREHSERVDLSAEGKREGMIQKITADIVEKITRHGPQDAVEKEIVGRLEEEMGQKIAFEPQQTPEEFIYNTLDDDGQKTTRHVSLRDGDIVLRRLEALTRETISRNMAGERRAP